MPEPCPVPALRPPSRSAMVAVTRTCNWSHRGARSGATGHTSLISSLISTVAPLALVALALTTGCETATQWTQPWGGHVSQSGFFALTQANCSDLSVGERRLGDLLANDQLFQDLTTRLFQGDLSGDEYLNQLLALHPANDANVPATGCVIDQLQACQLGPCEVTESAALADTAPDLPPAPEDIEGLEALPATVPETPPAPRPLP